MILAAGASLIIMNSPAPRAIVHTLNRAFPNEIVGPSETALLYRHKRIDLGEFVNLLESQGYDETQRTNIMMLLKQYMTIRELIALYRRGGIKEIGELYFEAEKLGWSESDVDGLLRISETIPSAGDVIRYAVREVYSPEIAEAFGQFEGLEEIMASAADDIKAAGLPPDTFAKEWAAHWVLPAVNQGFEMLHRGIIPAKSTPDKPVSLERLMVALDVMPAWKDKLTAISYSPFTRVDVRRMHKIGVLSDEDIFEAYADVGFSPLVDGHDHVTVADAFLCDTCRHESKVGRMVDFTILYNLDPPEVEKTVTDKDRDLTKADIINGFRDGLLDDSDCIGALDLLGYGKDEIDYYMARVDYEQSKAELAESIRYLHDAFVKGIIDFGEVTDQLGMLDLPAKMTDYYLKVWEMERLSRTNKPTKSELFAFLRKGVIDETTWRAEMIGLGYPNRYIDWYAETV